MTIEDKVIDKGAGDTALAHFMPSPSAGQAVTETGNGTRGDYRLTMGQMKRQRRAAIYSRNSVDEGAEESEMRQERVCREYAARVGIEIVCPIFSDRAMTGTTMRRPQLKALLAACRDGSIDCVIVENVDRLSRELADAHHIFRTFEGHFIELHEAKDGKVDLLTFSLKALIAHEHRNHLLMRLKDGRINATESGRASHRVRFGYVPDREAKKKGQRLAHEDRAKVVRQIFTDFGEKKRSLSDIARDLSGKVPTPGNCTDIDHDKFVGKLSSWTLDMLRQILGCPMYAGWLVDGRTREIRDPETKEVIEIVCVPSEEQRCVEVPQWRIVDPTLWALCQQRLSERCFNIPAKNGVPYLLAKRTYCSCTEDPVRTFTRRGTGYLRCKGGGPSCCHGQPLQRIERWIYDLLDKNLDFERVEKAFHERQVHRESEAAAQDLAELDELRSELRVIGTKIQNLVALVERGAVEAEEVDERLKMRRAEKTAIEARLALAKKLPRISVLPTPEMRLGLAKLRELAPLRPTDEPTTYAFEVMKRIVSRVELAVRSGSTIEVALHADLGAMSDGGPSSIQVCRGVFDLDNVCLQEQAERKDRREAALGELAMPEEVWSCIEAAVAPFDWVNATAKWDLRELVALVFRTLRRAPTYGPPIQRERRASFIAARRRLVFCGAWDACVERLAETHPDFLQDIDSTRVRMAGISRRHLRHPGVQADRKLADRLFELSRSCGTNKCGTQMAKRLLALALLHEGESDEGAAMKAGLGASTVTQARREFAARRARGLDPLALFEGACAGSSQTNGAAPEFRGPEHEARVRIVALVSKGTTGKAMAAEVGATIHFVHRWRTGERGGSRSLTKGTGKLRHMAFPRQPQCDLVADQLEVEAAGREGQASILLKSVAMYLRGETATSIATTMAITKDALGKVWKQFHEGGSLQLLQALDSDAPRPTSDADAQEAAKLEEAAETAAAAGDLLFAQRLWIAALHMRGFNTVQIAKKLGCCTSNSARWVGDYRNRGPAALAPAPRTCILSEMHIVDLKRFVDARTAPDDPRRPASIPALTRYCRLKWGLTISGETVARSLWRNNIYLRKAPGRPISKRCLSMVQLSSIMLEADPRVSGNR